MKYKALNNTDLRVSALALGTDVYGTDLDKEQSYELLNIFTQAGGNLVDTALVYANWVPGEKSRSEKLIGRWMKEKKNRSEIIISTKGAHPETPGVSRLSRQDILSDIEKSLTHLQTDYIDVYWLHRDDEAVSVDEIMETLGELVKEGKTRYIGMSNWTYKRIDKANRYAAEHNLPVVMGSQLQYSAAVPNIEGNDPTLVLMNDEEYGYFAKEKLNVFAFASQAKGFFSKLDQGGEEYLSPKARERYLNQKSLKRYEGIKEIAQRTGHSVGEVAIGLVANNPNFPTIPIVGCKNTAQLKESIRGSCLEFSAEDLRLIHKI